MRVGYKLKSHMNSSSCPQLSHKRLPMDGVLGVIYQFTVARKDLGPGTILTHRLLHLIQPFLHDF
jgi:hypothetical protein